MITTASSSIIGLVLTVCSNDETNDNCEIYIPATYETKTMELGKELCRADFKKAINDVMVDDGIMFWMLNVSA